MGAMLALELGSQSRLHTVAGLRARPGILDNPFSWLFSWHIIWSRFKSWMKMSIKYVLIAPLYSSVLSESLNWGRQCSKCSQMSIEFSDADTLLSYMGLVKSWSTCGQESVCVGVWSGFWLSEVWCVEREHMFQSTHRWVRSSLWVGVVLASPPWSLLSHIHSISPEGPPITYWLVPWRAEVLLWFRQVDGGYGTPLSSDYFPSETLLLIWWWRAHPYGADFWDSLISRLLSVFGSLVVSTLSSVFCIGFI